ncbi:DCP2 family protein [Megaselia abdita]
MKVATTTTQQQYRSSSRIQTGTDLLNVIINSAKKSTNNTKHHSPNINNVVVIPSQSEEMSTKQLQQQYLLTQVANHNNNNHKNTIPSDILDDLASRFIINVPDDERNNLIRICFQIELAHWFYLDFFCAIEERKLEKIGMKIFAVHLFQHIPFLQKHVSTLDKILEDWKSYKLTVPTYGAILVSEDLKYCLLVQSYLAKSSWGFPKGKVNEHEDPVHCAIREVYEETGYDITSLIVPTDYIEANINYQTTRLYIVRNVPLDTQFTPRTRNEIKCCDWFPIDSLPTNKSDAISKQINANSFFMIIPFIKRLKKWISEKRSGIVNNHNHGNRKISSTSSSSTSPVMLVTTTSSSSTSVDITVAATTTSSSTTTTKNNNNNILNNKNKRQRHKSMGDIDGIKLNISNNFNCNGGTNTKYVKSNNHHNHIYPTTPNGCSMTNDWPVTTTTTTTSAAILGSSSSSKKSNCKQQSSNNNNNNNNSKRQLFNNNSNNNNNNFDHLMTNENNISSFDIIRKKNAEKKKVVINCNNNNNNNSNNSRQRTKSQQQQQPQALVAQQPEKVEDKEEGHVLKFNPNFDSWTNFSFTKNFITNVFC